MSRTYMVVGYYEDGGRYATTVEASSGEEAERIMLLEFRRDNTGDDWDDTGLEYPTVAGTVFINDKGEMEIGS